MIFVSFTAHDDRQVHLANNTEQEKDEMEDRHAITYEEKSRHEGKCIFHRVVYAHNWATLDTKKRFSWNANYL